MPIRVLSTEVANKIAAGEVITGDEERVNGLAEAVSVPSSKLDLKLGLGFCIVPQAHFSIA